MDTQEVHISDEEKQKVLIILTKLVCNISSLFLTIILFKTMC